MLVRIRWFLLGVVVTLGGGALVVGRLVRLRRRLTPANLARAAGLNGDVGWLGQGKKSKQCAGAN